MYEEGQLKKLDQLTKPGETIICRINQSQTLRTRSIERARDIEINENLQSEFL